MMACSGNVFDVSMCRLSILLVESC